MIRTVVFDVGNVIWFFEEPLYLVHQQIAALTGFSYDVYFEQYLQDYQAFETGTLALDDWLRHLNPQVDLAQVDAILARSLASLTYNQPVLQLISRLRQQGVEVGMLSNCENFLYPYIHQPLESYFDFSLLSWQLGLRKPDPAIYQRIFQHTSSLPSEILFIDDKPQNIASATHLGIQGLQFFDCPQLLADFSRVDLIHSSVNSSFA